MSVYSSGDSSMAHMVCRCHMFSDRAKRTLQRHLPSLETLTAHWIIAPR